MAKTPSANAYKTSDTRKLALRVYVNEGERKLLYDAARKSGARDNEFSAWASKVLIKRACEIMNVPYLYPEV